MSDKTKIEWTDASWNPIAAFTRHDLWIAHGRIETSAFGGGELVPAGTRGWFCTKVSPGCAYCYAEGINLRLGNGLPYALANLAHIEFRLVSLDQPLRWKRPRHIFVCSMCDLFHAAIDDRMIAAVYGVMAAAPQHTFQVLTKRTQRMFDWYRDAQTGFVPRAWCVGRAAEAFRGDDGETNFRHSGDLKEWPLPNVLVGASTEDQSRLNERFEALISTPAAGRFLSCEPLLGPLDIIATWQRLSNKFRDAQVISPRPVRRVTREEAERTLHYVLHWIIVGGESGLKARPMPVNSARSLRDQCVCAGIAFFFKQWGEWWLPPSGKSEAMASFKKPYYDHATGMFRVGKRKAGRHLDGREWNEQPDLASPSLTSRITHPVSR